jgi:hypothetical protein
MQHRQFNHSTTLEDRLILWLGESELTQKRFRHARNATI